MGFADSIKGVWNSLNDKWYGFLDALDAKKIPVYSVIDPIDKVVPSLAVFLGLFIVILLGIVFLVFFSGPGLVSVEFSVVDSDGNPIEGALIVLEQEAIEEKGFAGLEKELISDKEGMASEMLFPSEVSVTVSKKGFNSLKETFYLDEGERFFELVLEAEGPALDKVQIYLKDSETRATISKEVGLSFKCSKGTAPREKKVYNGSYSVLVPEGCGELFVSTSSEYYYPKTDVALSSALETIYLDLNEKETPDNTASLASLKVVVSDLSGNFVSDALVSLSEQVNGLPGRSVASGSTDTSGVKLFSDLAANKTYSVDVYHAESGARNSKSIFLGEDAFETISFELDLTAPKKYIYLKFVDFNSSAVDEVKVHVFQNKQKVISDLSNESGEVKIAWNGTDANLGVLAEKQGFISKVIAPIELKFENESYQETHLIASDENNSGNALVKVYEDPTQGENTVPGAMVYLFDSSIEFAPYGFAQSDDSGKAFFESLPLNDYYALAVFTDVSGKSSEKELKKGETTEFIVYLDNKAEVSLIFLIEDVYEVAVGDAVIDLFDASLNETIEQLETDSSGLSEEISLPVGSYYVNVSKEGFMDSVRLLPDYAGNQNYTEIIKLYPNGFVDRPELFFEGYYSAKNIGNYLDGLIEKNKSYYGIFSFVIPENEYASQMAHFRIDQDQFLTAEESEVILTKISASGSGVSYVFDSFDSSDLFKTSGASSGHEFKSANVKYSVSGKVYSISTKFFVRSRAHEGLPKVPLFHKTKVFSEPEEESELKKEEFLIASCDSCTAERFTYSFMLDGENFSPESSIKPALLVGREHALGFSIMNETGADQENLNLIIVNGNNGLGFSEGDENSVLDLSETEFYVGDLGEEEIFSDELNIIPLIDSDLTDVMLDLDSSWHATDFKVISFKVLPEQELALIVDQSEFGLRDRQLSYYLSGKVHAGGLGAPIKNVAISFTHTPVDSGTELHESALTDENGFFEITINQPLFSPAPLIVSAEAAGYQDAEVEVPVKSGESFPETGLPECIDIIPESGEIHLTKLDFAKGFTLTNNCEQKAEARLSTVSTSDLKISLNESPAEFIEGQHFFLEPGEEKKIIIQPNIFLGIHPINLELILKNPETEDLLFTESWTVFIDPYGEDNFDLIGRSDYRQRYEFSLFNSIDELRANYKYGFPDYLSTNCNYLNLNECPPWALIFKPNGKSFTQGNLTDYEEFTKVIPVYNKVFFEQAWPGIGLDAERTGILADATKNKNPFSSFLSLDNELQEFSLIKIGINGIDLQDAEGIEQEITELKLKLTVNEDSGLNGFDLYHYLNISWSEEEPSSIPLELTPGFGQVPDDLIYSYKNSSEEAYSHTGINSEGKTILLDLLAESGISVKGIYSFALIPTHGSMEFFSADSSILPVCLILNGKEYCGKEGWKEITGDCYMDASGSGRSFANPEDPADGSLYWGQYDSVQDLRDAWKPYCGYCCAFEGCPSEEENPDLFCYGDARKFYYNPDGSLKEGLFYVDSCLPFFADCSNEPRVDWTPFVKIAGTPEAFNPIKQEMAESCIP
ncbi:MAG: carboxypeptidase-like regulatory domain-containing protein, partial [Candidatus Diapherotrites archaeon]